MRRSRNWSAPPSRRSSRCVSGAHWNISNIQPIDPVALGLCKQSELDAAVQKANAKKARDGEVMSDDERRKLVSTEQSLGGEPDAKIPTAISGLGDLHSGRNGRAGRERGRAA